MPPLRLSVLPLLGLSLLAAKARASGPEAAITRAAIAPFQDALRHDAAALCADLVPAVAAMLVDTAAAADGCTAAASGVFALTAPNEPPAEPGLSLEPAVEDLEVLGQRATLKLSFTFVTVTKKPGLTTAAIHHAGPIKLELEEVGGTWLVSSRARLATVPGCRLPKPRRCPRGARVLSLSVGEIEPAQPGLELPSPIVPPRASDAGSAKSKLDGSMSRGRAAWRATGSATAETGGRARTSRTSARSSRNERSSTRSSTRERRCRRSDFFPPRSSTTSYGSSPRCGRSRSRRTVAYV
jgi:hypothetical protein